MQHSRRIRERTTYVRPLEPYFESINATFLTPWQTCNDVGGIGDNDEANWPENVHHPAPDRNGRLASRPRLGA